MKNLIEISRRTFCLGLFAGGAAKAANPIIDLNVKKDQIVDMDLKRPNIPKYYGQFIDLEPDESISLTRLYKPNVNTNLSQESLNLLLVNVHTGDRLPFVIPKTLNFTNFALHQFNHICRDWRHNQIKPMDQDLLRILGKICEDSAEQNSPVIVQILSGYRTHKTNEMLRRKSSLVAKDSYHMKGKALDFRLPNVGLQQLKKSAQDHASGGLGIYQNFIHIDTGPPRSWLI